MLNICDGMLVERLSTGMTVASGLFDALASEAAIIRPSCRSHSGDNAQKRRSNLQLVGGVNCSSKLLIRQLSSGAGATSNDGHLLTSWG